MEHKSKGESLEKCQAELKKLRRKSQGSKNPSKYGDKEMQVSQSCSLNANKLNLLLSTFFFGGLVTWKMKTFNTNGDFSQRSKHIFKSLSYDFRRFEI